MLITKQQLALIITSAVLLVFFAFRVAYHPISDNDRSRLIGIISVARYSKLEASDASYIKTGDRVEYDGKIFSSKPPLLHVGLGVLTKFELKNKFEQ